jgi:hypothetical protein
MTAPRNGNGSDRIIDFPQDPAIDAELARLREQIRTAEEPDSRELSTLVPLPPLWLRILIAGLGLIQTAIVVPWFLGADPLGLLDPNDAAHLTRDGAIGLIISASALLAAWRSRWAVPAFVLASVAVIAQTVATLIERSEVSRGAGELVHLPSVLLTCLIGLSGIRLRPLGPGSRHPTSASTGRRHRSHL